MSLNIQCIPYRYLTSLIQPIQYITTHILLNYNTTTVTPRIQHFRYVSNQSSKPLSPRPLHHNRTSSSHKIFQDRIRLTLTAGRGGNGCSSVLKSRDGKSTPNGGNGGNGGSIYIQSINTIQTYEFSSYHINAINGQNGQSNDCTGKNGNDIVINVPCGTVVHSINGKDPDTNKLDTTYIIDLCENNMKYLLCRGGHGGYGNKTFKREYRRNSEYSSVGELGATMSILLELKTLADVGLVGYPNSGKSSLLGAISAARPTVADYPFTTLQPYVGMVDVNDISMSQFSVADIPGLIDGAHMNRGLGHEFLRHIERTKILLYVIDVSEFNQRDPLDDYITLQNELKLYQHSLIDRPNVIYCNKIDTNIEYSQQQIQRIQQYTNMSVPILSGSALHGTNMSELVTSLYATLQSVQHQLMKQQIEQSKKQASIQHELQQKRAQYAANNTPR